MQSSCSALCVLILLVTTFTAAVPPVKVKLHDSATLPCSKRCSGSAKWTLFDKSSGTLAECDQTSCRSKPGYQMTLAAYRAGDLSLIITDADFTKSNTYACDCDGKDICDVTLQVEHSESTIPSVKVNLHNSANLSCSERCSGLARWTKYHKPTDALAECNQTDCRSVKEGYQMIHDRLTITDADFTKRGWYTCLCDGTYLCDVALRIEALNTPRQIKAGESVFLDLDISDPVEVIYSSTGSSSGQICTVDGHSLLCKPEYKQRASVQTVLELKEIKPSDSGDYTIRDFRNKEDIHIYTVTISDGEPLPTWAIALIAVVAVVAFLAVGILICFLRNKKIREVLKTESIFYWKPEQNRFILFDLSSRRRYLLDRKFRNLVECVKSIITQSPDAVQNPEFILFDLSSGHAYLVDRKFRNLVECVKSIITQSPDAVQNSEFILFDLSSGHAYLGDRKFRNRMEHIEGITQSPDAVQNPEFILFDLSSGHAYLLDRKFRNLIERMKPITQSPDAVQNPENLIERMKPITQSPDAVQNPEEKTYENIQVEPDETTKLK